MLRFGRFWASSSWCWGIRCSFIAKYKVVAFQASAPCHPLLEACSNVFSPGYLSPLSRGNPNSIRHSRCKKSIQALPSWSCEKAQVTPDGTESRMSSTPTTTTMKLCRASSIPAKHAKNHDEREEFDRTLAGEVRERYRARNLGDADKSKPCREQHSRKQRNNRGRTYRAKGPARAFEIA